MHPFQHILVPTDFEEPADRAIEVAITLAGSLGARLTIVHVFTTEALDISRASLLPLEAMVAEAEGLLRDHVVDAEERGITAEGLLIFGDPTADILAAIDSHEADMVVMGTHGRRGRASLMLGSVAEEVVRRSKVPTLTASANGHVRDVLLRSAFVPRMGAPHPTSTSRASDLGWPRWTPAND